MPLDEEPLRQRLALPGQMQVDFTHMNILDATSLPSATVNISFRFGIETSVKHVMIS